MENLRFDDGRMIKAGQYGASVDEAEAKLELSEQEKQLIPALKVCCFLLVSLIFPTCLGCLEGHTEYRD